MAANSCIADQVDFRLELSYFCGSSCIRMWHQSMGEDTEMAKTSSKTKAGRARTKARLRKKGDKAPAKAQVAHMHEEDHIDGCDFELDESEATPDAALPAAMGGVEILGGRRRRKSMRT